VPEPGSEFAEILRRLNENNVRYVLIGGLAMMLHGSAHITQDIDIGYARDRENYEALADALRSMNARLRNVPPGVPFFLDAHTFRNTQNLTLDTDLAPFDLLGHISGAEDFDELFARSLLAEIDGVPVHIASLDDLILMKRAANRQKDQNHILELEALRRLRNAESD
jgi:predicted nucleotidyltransferase